LQTASANNTSRWLWYTLAGGCIAAAAFVYGFYGRARPIGRQFDSWAELVGLTLVVFGYLLRWFWRYKSSRDFWFLYTALLLVHSAIFLPMFSHGARWPLLTLGFVGAVEGMLFFGLLISMRERFSSHSRG